MRRKEDGALRRDVDAGNMLGECVGTVASWTERGQQRRPVQGESPLPEEAGHRFDNGPDWRCFPAAELRRQEAAQSSDDPMSVVLNVAPVTAGASVAKKCRTNRTKPVSSRTEQLH